MKLPTVPNQVLFMLAGSIATFMLTWHLLIAPYASYVPQFVVGSVSVSDSKYRYAPLEYCEPSVQVAETPQYENAVDPKPVKPVDSKPKTSTRPKQKPIPEEDATPEEPILVYAKAKPGNPMPDINPRYIVGGLVMVRIVVAEDGTVRSASVDMSSGSSRQDKAAIKAFKKWKFTPASKDGVPVQSVVYLPVNYGG